MDLRGSRQNSTIMRASNSYGMDGFRSFISPISPAPSAVSTPSNASSMTKFFSTFLPSAFNQKLWTSTTVEKNVTVTAVNGSASSTDWNGERNRQDRGRHILGLDAYCSSDEYEEEEAPTTVSSKNRPYIDFHGDTPSGSASARKRIRPSPAISNASTANLSREINYGIESARKRSRPSPGISNAATAIYSRESNYGKARIYNSETRRRPLSGASSASAASSSVVASSVVPSSIGFRGGVSSSRTSSAQSRSRLSSGTSNGSTASSSRDINYGRSRVYNSETRHILKDLDRTSTVPSSVIHYPNSSTRSVVDGSVADFTGNQMIHYPNSSTRNVVDGPMAGFSGHRGSKRAHVTSTLSAEAQAVPRLATLDSSSLYRPWKDRSRDLERRSQNGSRKRHQAETMIPVGWIVSSGPIFRFTKPLAATAEKHDGKRKNHIEPPIFRFRGSLPSSTITTAAAGITATTEHFTRPSQSQQVHFNFNLRTRGRADGNFQ